MLPIFIEILLDSSKHLDHSFERLIRSSRAQSPFHREFTSTYREAYPSIRDTYSSASRDSLRPPPLSYRSKSYHGDLSRISYSAISSHFDDRRTDFSRSDRSRSRSVTNLATNNLRHSLSSFPSSYVNTYSRHHSHHNHQVAYVPRAICTSIQINSRSRFRARNAYKAYRSRSANRHDERDYSLSRSIRASTPVAHRPPDTTISHFSSHDSLTSTKFSKSLSDIRAIQSRINNELLRPLHRESSSIRHIEHSSELASHILNPDIYVRWLKNKWDMEEYQRRRQYSLSARSSRFDDSIDQYVRTVKNRVRGSSYPSRVKYSHDSSRYSQHPSFSKTIRGNFCLRIEFFYFIAILATLELHPNYSFVKYFNF